jgi:PAS domain S-box-containing protein
VGRAPHATSYAHVLSKEALLSDLLDLSEEQRFRLLISSVTDYAIYLLDSEGRVATWNPGAERFKGYKADEIIGHHFSRFFTPEDVAAGLPQKALQAAARDDRFEAEGWRLRKDGTRFWVNAVIDAIRAPDGSLLGFAKVTRDLTEKKRAAEELDQTREALAQAQKLQALGELTGGIAHDFNNLMTVVAGASDFLLKNRGLPEEKKISYLKAIVETTKRATELTNHLLAFGRRQSIKPVVIDLAVRLDAFAEMIGRMLGSQFKVTLDIQSKSPLVEVDAAQLETALLNASVNARDAMRDGGELTLSVSDCKFEDKDAVCITVRDTGGGIPESVLKRVFEPFFTTKAVGEGTGLGLSQIHGFAAQAGGAAAIESEEGVGTTLKISLPRTGKPVEAPAPENRPSSLPKGLKVLLVEDNPQVRDFAAKLLGDVQCKVVAVDDGTTALDRARSSDFDLVFSDVVIPGLSGVQLAERLEQERPDMPVLLATGYSKELHSEHAQRYAVVAKPYDGTSLVAAIAAVLEERRGRAA